MFPPDNMHQKIDKRGNHWFTDYVPDVCTEIVQNETHIRDSALLNEEKEKKKTPTKLLKTFQNYYICSNSHPEGEKKKKIRWRERERKTTTTTTKP